MQDRLDPIDWAIYGMYLWQNEAAAYQRVRILFGLLLISSKAHRQVPTLQLFALSAALSISVPLQKHLVTLHCKLPVSCKMDSRSG